MPKAQNAFLPQTSAFGRYAYIKSHITYCGEGQMGSRLLASRLYSWPFDAVRCIGCQTLIVKYNDMSPLRITAPQFSVIAAHSVGQWKGGGENGEAGFPW